jgi:hypothetical protein
MKDLNPKEKAKELVEQFTFRCEECDYDWNAKQCALIAINELINDCDASSPFEEQRLTYWQEVKQEIEQL